MTPGKIWGVMLRRKVFQQWEIVEELSKEFSHLPKSYIKMKVEEMVKLQTRNQVLVKVNDKPPILAVSKYIHIWKEHYTTYYECEVCSRRFIPSMPHQKVCSEKCKHQHQVKLCKEYRRPYEERTKNRRFLPWSPQEEEMIKQTFPNLKYSKVKALELSKLLKRSPEAIRRRLYEIKRGARA